MTHRQRLLRLIVYPVGGAIVTYSLLGIAGHTFGIEPAKKAREFIDTTGYTQPARPQDKRSAIPLAPGAA